MKKKALLTVASLVAASGVAVAADMPVKTAAPSVVVQATWTGLYAGVNVGYGQTVGSTHFTAIDQFFFATRIASGEIPSSLSPQARGFLGGIQAGYNYQVSPRSMFGFEADIAYSDIRGERSFISVPIGADPTITTTQQERIDWFGTFRGRAGFLFTPNYLAYLTGGLAFGRGTATTGSTVSPGLIGGAPFCGPVGNVFCSDGSTKKILVGWTAGAGLEHLIWDRWSVKVEYLYFDLGRESYTVVSQQTSFGPVMQADASFRGHIGRFGLNYRFGAGSY